MRVGLSARLLGLSRLVTGALKKCIASGFGL